MVLVIDNYDSFTYNLVQYVKELKDAVEVVRNDAVTVKALTKMHPSKIIVSPGPGKPREAGISEEVETIEDVYEPYLMQLGFIERTPRGRMVTQSAAKHVGRILKSDKKNPPQEQLFK